MIGRYFVFIMPACSVLLIVLRLLFHIPLWLMLVFSPMAIGNLILLISVFHFLHKVNRELGDTPNKFRFKASIN
jgi:hypothetical protein